MHERFVMYLSLKKLSARKVAEMSCISASTVTRFCNGREIGSDKLLCMLQICDDLSLEWLFFGSGEMLRTQERVTYNMGAFAGADVDNREGVLISGTGKVGAGPRMEARYRKQLEEKDRLIAEKDKVISERDRVIGELLSRLGTDGQ